MSPSVEPIEEELGLFSSVEVKSQAYYITGDKIIVKGDDSHHAYKLIAGTAKVIKNGDVVCTIHAGEYFGSIAALTASKRNATVIASSDCVVQQIPRQRFADLVKRQPHIIEKIK